jgi:hypothetical protein
MSNLPEIQCGSCMYFKENKDRHGSEGACMFNPPQVFPMQGRNALNQPVLNWMSAPHPAVSAENYCGQWNPVQEVKPDVKTLEN